MTVEADIFATLRTLVSDRVYPDFAPVGAARPYITYHQIGGQATQFMERALPSLKNGHFQISTWGDTRAQVASISGQVETAMVQATAFQCDVLAAPIARYDEEVPIYGAHQDFSIWSAR